MEVEIESIISTHSKAVSNQVMTLVSLAKKGLTRLGICQSSSLLLPQTSPSSIESLETPLVCYLFMNLNKFLLHNNWHYCSWKSMVVLVKKQVQDIVLAADLHCPNCQKRVANVISNIDGKFSKGFLGDQDLRS